MKKFFLDEKERVKLIQSLLLGIVCIVLAVVAYRSIVETGIVNLVFLFFALLNLREAVIENINRKKVVPLFNAAIVSIIAMILNIELFDTLSKRILLENILNWCTAWILITAAAFSYLSVILYRNMRWTQEEYEQWVKLKQDRRFENKQVSENYKIAKKKTWSENEKKKLEIKSKKQRIEYEKKSIKWEAERKKLEKDIKVKEQDDEIKRINNRLQIWADLRVSERPGKLKKTKKGQKNTLSSKKRGLEQNKEINIIAVIISVFLLALLLIIPAFNGFLSGFIKQWIISTASLLGLTLKPSESGEPLSGIGIIATYTVVYIAIIGVLFLAYLLLIQILKKIVGKLFFSNNQSGSGVSDFLDEYGTAISILIVSLCVVTVFGDLSTIDLAKKTWETLLKLLLWFLVMFAAVDIVKLLLEQCLLESSLLLRCIRYIYILLINTAMEIILGVFYGLRVSEWISSIVSLLIPVPASELYDEIKKSIDEALKKEIEIVKKGKKKNQQNNKHMNLFRPFQSQEKNIRDEEET